MPDDIKGNYSLPNGYLAVTGEKVLPSNHNPPLEDIAAALTARYSRDGRAPMLGNVPMNGFLAKGMGDGVDPGDAINKGQLDNAVSGINAALTPRYIVKSGNYTALNADTNTSIRFTSAATLSFDVTANLRTNWRIEVWNDSTGNIVLDPNSTDKINGAATLILQPGQKAGVFKTGSTTFQASIFGDQLSGLQLRGYINGLTLSNNATDPTNDIDIATGSAASDGTTPVLMALGVAITKRLDAAWAVGSGNGGLDTGSKANSTGYHVWLIARSDTGVVDALFSTSATSPTMPANYDRKRRIGWVVTDGSGSIRSFIQDGDRFLYNTASPPLDINTTTQGISRTLRDVSVPLGLKVVAILRGRVAHASAATTHLLTDPDLPDSAPGLDNCNFGNGAGSSDYGEIGVPTNSSGQVATRSSNTNSILAFRTTGWIDLRGRDK